MGRLTDYFEDRIALNPKQSVVSGTDTTPLGGDGSLDSKSDTGGMNATGIAIDSMGKTMKAPENPVQWQANTTDQS